MEVAVGVADGVGVGVMVGVGVVVSVEVGVAEGTALAVARGACSVGTVVGIGVEGSGRTSFGFVPGGTMITPGVP